MTFAEKKQNSVTASISDMFFNFEIFLIKIPNYLKPITYIKETETVYSFSLQKKHSNIE